jgi:tagatose 6-phosphate kinase
VIVTLTLNAALHVQYESERVTWGARNDIRQVGSRAGGRGLAVARLLHAFGHEVMAAGLAGGAAGELISTDLARAGVPNRFTAIGRESRRVIEVADAASGTSTGFAEPGPFITTEEVGRLAADYRSLMTGATAAVLCGSLPAGLPAEVYGTLATYAAEAGVPAVIDASGEPLRHGLSRRPALVVPGAGKPDAALDGLDPAALVADGVGAVVLACDGALRAVTAEGDWRAAPAADPEAPGFRSALVAGLVPGLVLGWSWPDRLRHAVALSAAATSAGDVDLSRYETLLPQVSVAAG